MEPVKLEGNKIEELETIWVVSLINIVVQMRMLRQGLARRIYRAQEHLELQSVVITHTYTPV